MKIIAVCPQCEQDFMYDPNHDYHLYIDGNSPDVYKEYPIQDGTWTSRRWNKEMTESTDLSGNIVICQECHEKSISAD